MQIIKLELSAAERLVPIECHFVKQAKKVDKMQKKKEKRQRVAFCKTVPMDCRSVKHRSGQMQKTANFSQQFFPFQRSGNL